jgi:hypothetical protein
MTDAGDGGATDDLDAETLVDAEALAEEERVDAAEELGDLVADQDETAFDETRLQYSGVEEGDGDVDVEEYAEAGALFDDPEDIVLLQGGIDDPDGSDGWA